MANAQTLLFLSNQLSSKISSAEIEAVAAGTESGNMHFIRDANFVTWWKPPNDLVNNHSIRADFQDGNLIGAAGETCYWGIAYDPRNIDQTTIILQYDSADNPSFSGATSYVIISSGHSSGYQYPTCQWQPFVMPTPAKRYWRVQQRISDRAGSGRTIKLFYWAMCGPNHIVDIDAGSYGPGLSRSGLLGSGQMSVGPGSVMSFNNPSISQQTFDITVTPSNTSMFNKIRDGLYNGDLLERAFFVQYEGLRNEAETNFFLCRIDRSQWDALKNVDDTYEITLPLITEAFL